MLLEIARELASFAAKDRTAWDSSEPRNDELRKVLVRAFSILAVHVGHDARLLRELSTGRDDFGPLHIERDDALIKPLYGREAIWSPPGCVQLRARGHVTLRFIAEHLLHLGLLLSRVPEPDAVTGVLRLCKLVATGLNEYVFLVHKPLADVLGHGLLTRAWRNPLLHSREYYESSLQAFYRDVPGLMFFDYQPTTSAPLLRTAIELKLREAIGIGAFRLTSGTLRILGVGDIIRLRHRLQLESITPLTHVARVYRWLNYALHGGARLTVALLWFAQTYLKAFLRGAQVTPRVMTANPVWSNLDDANLEAVLRRALNVPATATPIGVRRIGPP